MIVTSRSIVGHGSPCRAAARITEPGIASSSGVRPAAMSRCIELPSVSCARSSSAIARRRVDVGALRAPRGGRLLHRRDEVGAQLRRRADLAEQLVVGARRAGERVEPHELRPHHVGFGVEDLRRHARAVEGVGELAHRRRDRRGARHADEQERARVHDDPGLRPVRLDPDRAGQHGVGGEAPPQHREVVEPVEQRQHERGLDLDPVERLLESQRLGRDEQRVNRLGQRRRPRAGAPAARRI